MSDAIHQSVPDLGEGPAGNLAQERPVGPKARSLRLAGRVAVITGGARGVSRAVARALFEEGCAVALQHSREAPAARSLARELDPAEGRARALLADLTRPEECHRLIERAARELGAIDILVNGEGVFRERPLRKMAAADWDEVLASNLSSVFHCTKAALEPMIQRGWGRIVNLAGPAGQTAAAGQSSYAAAKAGVIAFTRSISQELGRHGITANAICPGDDERPAALGRAASADEVARLVRFLCTEGDWLTGAQLNVSEAPLV